MCAISLNISIDMWERSVTRRGVIELASIGLGVGDEFGNAVHRDGRTDHQDIGHTHDARDRIAVPQEIVVEVCVKGCVDGVGRIGKEERIAVGRRPDHVFGADIVGGAGPVLDHELAVEAARQPIGNQPRHHVDRAPGGKPTIILTAAG